MKPDPAAYAEWLRHRRQEAGLSQEKLGELAGLASGTICRIERGARSASRNTRLLIQEALLSQNRFETDRERFLRQLLRECVDVIFSSPVPPNVRQMAERIAYELTGEVRIRANPTLAQWAVPPGDVLLDVLREHQLRQADLARRWGTTPNYVSSIVRGRLHCSPRVALCLEAALGHPSAEFWLGLQTARSLFEERAQLSPLLARIRSRAKA